MHEFQTVNDFLCKWLCMNFILSMTFCITYGLISFFFFFFFFFLLFLVFIHWYRKIYFSKFTPKNSNWLFQTHLVTFYNKMVIIKWSVLNNYMNYFRYVISKTTYTIHSIFAFTSKMVMVSIFTKLFICMIKGFSTKRTYCLVFCKIQHHQTLKVSVFMFIAHYFVKKIN